MIEEQQKQQQSLFQVFVFSCQEAGVTDDTDVLHQVYCTLLEKMIHTHGNEFIQNRRMLANIESGKTVDAPIMLRDCLKVLAVKGKNQN